MKLEDLTGREGMCHIIKGGENILNNTYGFEIEFASHNNDVFKFTHVTAASLKGNYRNSNGESIDFTWNIESDSGGVLELVTDILRFNDLGSAIFFKNSLAESLVVLFKHNRQLWVRFEELFRNFHTTFNRIHQLHGTERIQSSTLEITNWNDVRREINLNNIDNGVSISHALASLELNKDNWNDYVKNTILIRSEKDWRSFYSTQLNMPMTMRGYYGYCLKKLQKFLEVRVPIIQSYIAYRTTPQAEFLPTEIGKKTQELIGSQKDLNLIRWVGNGLWLLILESIVTTMLAELGPDNRDITIRSLIFLTIFKIITGAFGALSERQQLYLQRLAWTQRSTTVMENDGSYYANNLKDERGQPIRWNFLEYHSSMKDLIGLWFKGDLLSVFLRHRIQIQKIFNLLEKHDISAILITNYGNCQRLYFSHKSIFGENNRYKINFFFDLEELNIKILCASVKHVQASLLAKLSSLLPDMTTAEPFLHPIDRRPFLEYNEQERPWEGRYDTMVDVPPKDDIDPLFLVEHRNN